MITPEQQQEISKYLGSAKYTPPVNPMSSSTGSSWYDAVQAKVEEPAVVPAEIPKTEKQKTQEVIAKRTDRVSDVLNEGADKFAAADERQARGEQNTLETLTQKFGTGIATASDVGFETLRSLPGIGGVIDRAEEGIKKGLEDESTIVGKLIRSEPVKKAMEKYQSLDEATKADLGALFEIVSAVAGGGATKAAQQPLKTAAKEVIESVAKTGTDLVENAVKTGTKIVENRAIKSAEKNISTIQEIISPKITSKETKKIIDENRLTRGKDSFIFGKQPDIVDQSEAVKRSAETIERNIPDAHKLDDAKLSTALDKQTTEMAKSLSGDMKSVPVKQETTGKVVERWKELKAEQQNTPEFLDNEAGNKAFQAKFENYLKELEWDITDATGKFKSPTPKNMDDIWNVRKAYDQSIPSNVKNATEASSPVLQGRKAMWLQNRAILNSAINDSVDGLGDASKKAFADMSDMYDALENIRSKAKIDLKGKEGILPNTTKGWLKAAGGAGVTYLIGREILN